ncbi:hypothetical protein [Petropleomorpha daqingensis]|uniref:Uncharacterized protein n=1 Tax=Petropleomorpha daqingensis TaxID=2026353 RepID=A0A853CKW4_9ACTN|nr:hypothetical protein [Petropleomorpha daqingensis]NYJ07182.1 hypothetical protein [Petropleomorpha daqingensis]
MTEVLLAVGGLVVLVGVPVGFLLLGRRARRRGIGGSVLAPLEEIWDPVAHRTNIEIQVQAEAEAPAPSPDDRP